MRSSCALFAIISITCYGLTAAAADDSEPVNPFAQPAPGNRGVSARISDEADVSNGQEKRGFSLPKLWLPKLPMPSLPKPQMPNFRLPKMQIPKVSMPQWTKQDMSRDPGPSTFEKLSNGTKSMFTKTRDTLMPWAAKDNKPVARNATGSRASTGFSRTRVASNRGSGEPSGEKKSLFSSFLPSSEPEEKRINTTQDFLSQKRPPLD